MAEIRTPFMFRRCLCVVAFTFFSTTALAAIEPETPVATPSEIVAAPRESVVPEVASNGRDFLVVWSDLRGGTPHVYAARVGADGTLLDRTGILVSRELAPNGRFDERPSDPDVVWIGSAYVVAWSCGGSYEHKICLAFVDDAGRVAPHPASGRVPGYSPSVAWSGSRLLITSTSSNFDPVILRTVLDAGGRVIDSRQLSQDIAADSSVTWTGQRFVAVWRDLRTESVGARSLDEVGNLIGSQLRYGETPRVLFSPTIGAGSSGSLVVWREYADGASMVLKARRIDSAGNPVGEPFQLGSVEQFLSPPKISWNGENFLVASSAGPYPYGRPIPPDADVFMVAVSSDGQVRATLRHTAPRRQVIGGIGWNGTAHLVVWDDYRFNTAALPPAQVEIFGRLADRQGTMGDPGDLLISRSHTEQEAGAVEWNGNGFVTTWAEAIGDDRTRAVFIGTLQRDGSAPTGRGVRLRTTDADQAWPRLSLTDAGGIAVWSERSPASEASLYGRTLSLDGTPVGEPFVISNAADFSAPAIASDGENFLVAWRDAATTAIFGLRLMRSGQVLTPAFQISVAPFSPGDIAPAIAWDGRNYLVAWASAEPYECHILCPGPAFRIETALVTRSGFVAGSPFPVTARWVGFPAVASSGTEFLVVFTAGGSIHGVRISPQGTLLDGLPERNGLRLSRLAQREGTALSWTGQEYVIAASSSGFLAPPNRFLDLVYVRRDGTVRGEESFPIEAVGPIALSSAPAPVLAVTYERFAFEQPFEGVKRVFARFVAGADPRRRSVRR